MNRALGGLVAAALCFRAQAFVAVAVLLLAGIIALKCLPIDAYPELSDPSVRVITLLPGKGPEEVEQLVTVPLEKELNGISGQTSLRSLSLYGLSVVTATFGEATQSWLARQYVLERVQQADLPAGANPDLDPDVGSIGEIFRYCLRSRYYSPMGLRSIQQWELEKLFRQVPGVIHVCSDGGPTKSYQVNVDPYRLIAHKVSLKQVFDAISGANASTGGGFLEKSGNALIVRELGLLKGADDIRKIVLKSDANGTAITAGDVADVTIAPLVRRGQVGKDRDDDVVEGIVLLRRGENPSRVLRELHDSIAKITSRLPRGVSLVPLYDRTQLIDQTVATIRTNVVAGISLVVVLLIVFFVDLRLAMITACVIPLSMLVAFICLSTSGIPANLLSLGGVDFGILVDCAVVMTENILRRLDKDGENLGPRERLGLIRRSAAEVASPVVFGVIVIISTFVPIFAFTGVEGKLFRPLAVTMCSALAGSCLLSLTVVPVLCSFLYAKSVKRTHESPLFNLFRRLYVPVLRWALAKPLLVILCAVISVVAGASVALNLGCEFLPHLDEGNVWIRATMSPGSATLTESVDVARRVRLCLLKFPEVTQVLSQEGGSDDGTEASRFADQEYFVDLKPAREWRPQFARNKEILISAMRKELEQFPGVSYYFTQYIQTMLDEALSGVEGSLVGKVVGDDLPTLERLGRAVGQIMRQVPGITDVIVDPVLGQPQLVMEINREAAARYGVNVQDLRDLVETAIGGSPATKVIEGERRYSVVVRLASSFRSTREALQDQLIDTPSGMKIPISQVATFKEVNGAIQIWRDSGSRLATIRANVSGRDLAGAVAELQKRVTSEIRLPEGYSVDWSGEFERQREAMVQLSIVLPVTLAIILVVLYIACGSLTGAMIVFAVVPLAAVGAIAGLYVTRTYFSISAGVGLIALFGIAVMNGILLISCINGLIEDGAEIEQAVYQGAVARMRPVLMTAAIAAVGLLPAALSNEIGAQSQRPFAIVIIGGLMTSTLLTLLVLPALYRRFGGYTRRRVTRTHYDTIPPLKEPSYR